MSKLDVYYKAFLEYRKQTLNDTACQKDRVALKKAGLDFDKLETTKYLCTIEEDWIKAIEDGLVFVEKAVAEERQFIRTNSDVVPVEKVKKIAKQTIEHLARHSELITHVPENEDDNVIPDKLLMVEKLSDFAVYENRFLYMLLCYLRDFINLRLEKIENLIRSYKSVFNVDKEVSTAKRTFRFTASFVDERIDNQYPLPDEKSRQLIVRIKDCLQFVIALLNRPVMVEVAKAPMLKPPITKTNVLKMNNNFKNSVALYEYIVSYNGLGFESELITTNYEPFSDKIADEVSEIINLTSFLNYKYGNDLENTLKLNYQEEQNRLAEEAAKKLQDQIKRLRKRIAEEGYSPEEYMLLLEKRNDSLEQDSKELKIVQKEVAKLNEKINTLEKEKQECYRQIDELKDRIETMKIEHQNQISEMIAEHNKKINDMNIEHQEEINNLNEKHQEEINNLNALHEENIIEINAQNESKIESIKNDFNLEKQKIQHAHSEYIESLNSKMDAMSNENKENIEMYENRVADFKEQLLTSETIRANVLNDYENSLKDIQLYKAEIRALRLQQGLEDNEDYTSKERFNELEMEFIAWNEFFKANWELTKKAIRKNVLWTKEDKKKKKKKKKSNVKKK